ncbi:uncharacterized protein LOC100181954 [Ciona intestinalis]
MKSSTNSCACGALQLLCNTSILVVAFSLMAWGIISKLHVAGYLETDYATEAMVNLTYTFIVANAIHRISSVVLLVSGSLITFNLVLLECWSAKSVLKKERGELKKLKIFLHVLLWSQILMCVIVAVLCIFGKDFIIFNMEAYMTTTIEEGDPEATASIESYQIFFGCCGAHNISDWSSQPVPISCCIIPLNNCSDAYNTLAPRPTESTARYSTDTFTDLYQSTELGGLQGTSALITEQEIIVTTQNTALVNGAVYTQGCNEVVTLYSHTTTAVCILHLTLVFALYFGWAVRLKINYKPRKKSQIIKVVPATADNSFSSRTSLVRDTRSEVLLLNSMGSLQNRPRRPNTTSHEKMRKIEPTSSRILSLSETKVNAVHKVESKCSIPQFQDWNEVRKSVDGTNQRWADISRTQLKASSSFGSDENDTTSLVSIQSIEW